MSVGEKSLVFLQKYPISIRNCPAGFVQYFIWSQRSNLILHFFFCWWHTDPEDLANRGLEGRILREWFYESNGGKINLYCDVDYAPHEFMPPVPVNVYWGGLPFSGWDIWWWGRWHKNYGKNMENLQGTSSRPQSSHVLDQLRTLKVWDCHSTSPI